MNEAIFGYYPQQLYLTQDDFVRDFNLAVDALEREKITLTEFSIIAEEYRARAKEYELRDVVESIDATIKEAEAQW